MFNGGSLGQSTSEFSNMTITDAPPNTTSEVAGIEELFLKDNPSIIPNAAGSNRDMIETRISDDEFPVGSYSKTSMMQNNMQKEKETMSDQHALSLQSSVLRADKKAGQEEKRLTWKPKSRPRHDEYFWSCVS